MSDAIRRQGSADSIWELAVLEAGKIHVNCTHCVCIRRLPDLLRVAVFKHGKYLTG
jgi:hypothetical protein